MRPAAAPVRAAPHDGAVPRVSFFYGIVITMYFYDHQPPHFHAQYAEHHAVIAIDGTRVLVANCRPARSSLWPSGQPSIVRSLRPIGSAYTAEPFPSRSTRCRKMER
jgi:hypothetical protein